MQHMVDWKKLITGNQAKGPGEGAGTPDTGSTDRRFTSTKTCNQGSCKGHTETGSGDTQNKADAAAATLMTAHNMTHHSTPPSPLEGDYGTDGDGNPRRFGSGQ